MNLSEKKERWFLLGMKKTFFSAIKFHKPQVFCDNILIFNFYIQILDMIILQFKYISEIYFLFYHSLHYFSPKTQEK